MDNKYANLPGIARNEPDVYETSNLVQPANNDRLESYEDDFQSIDKINITTKEAREKFNNKKLNADHADFSDSISDRRKFGYRVEPDNFEWDLIESPLQRFKRIEKELNDLKSDLVSNKYNEEISESTIGCDPVELLNQIETLQKQIANLHLESMGLKSESSNVDNKTKKDLLLDHLNQMKVKLNSHQKSESIKTGKQTENVDSGDSSIVFKLFADLDLDDLQQAKRVNELNSRLAQLEKLFGATNIQVTERQLGTLCSNIENKSVLGLIDNLSSKLDLINSQSVEQLESRLQTVLQRVTQLNEKKTVIEDHEKLQRINELYTIIARWKDLSAAVPTIVERLAALNELHEKAFQFASILSRLEHEQQSTVEKIETNQSVLTQLKKNMEENLESIKENFDILNKRVATISSK